MKEESVLTRSPTQCDRHIRPVKAYKHNPISLRTKNCNFSDVKCCNINEYRNKYMYSHPVFKLVDNFLKSPPGSARASAAMKKFSNANFGSKTCCGYSSVANKYITKKASFNVCSDVYNQDFLHSPTLNKRSLQSWCCMSKNLPCEKPQMQEKKSPHKNTDLLYIQNLKHELKCNYVTKCSHLEEDNEEYVNKLKDELTVAKSKMVDETRNNINTLKNEIIDYRSKRNCNCRQSPKSPKCEQAKTKPSTNEKTEGNRLVETLWQSKTSFPTSSGQNSTAQTPKIFEVQLEEANVLIEKVRQTLKDISMGVQQNKQPPSLPQPKENTNKCQRTANDKACINKEVKKVVTKLVENVVALEKKTKEEEKKMKRKKKIEEIQQEELRKLEDLRKQELLLWQEEFRKQEELRKQEEGRMLEELRKQEELQKEEREKLMKKKEEECRKLIQEELTKQKLELEKMMAETLELQKQEMLLQLVDEKGKKEIQQQTERKVEEPAEWISRNDRDVILTFSNSAKTSLNEYPDKLETISEHSAEEEKVNDSPLLQSPSTKGKPQQKKLCVQKLPPVSIRGGLVVQRTLNLTIKPTGSATNDLGAATSNVSYQEVKEGSREASTLPSKEVVTIRTCPEDCKDTAGHCKHLVEGNFFRKLQTLVSDDDIDSTAFLNLLNEDAMMLFKSYQILESEDLQHGGKSNQLLKNLASTQQSLMNYPTCSDTDQKASTLAGGAKKPANEMNVVVGEVLKQSRSPWETGFYKTAATQCSENDPDKEEGAYITPNSEDGFREGYMKEWTSVERVKSTIERGTSFISSNRKPKGETEEKTAVSEGTSYTFSSSMSDDDDDDDEEEGEEEEEEEEPVRDNVSMPDSTKRRVSLLVRSRMSEEKEMKIEPTKKIEASSSMSCSLAQGSSTSSDESKVSVQKTQELPAAVAEKPAEQPKKVLKQSTRDSISSTDSTTSSSMFEMPTEEKSSSLGHEEIRPKTVIPKSVPQELKEVPVKQESAPKKIASKPKVEKVDREQQTSIEYNSGLSSSESEDDQLNPMKSFIKGLTGTSEDELNKLRSIHSFPKSNLHEWSQTVMNKVKDSEELKRKPPRNKDFSQAKDNVEARETMVNTVDYANLNEETSSLILVKPESSPREKNHSDFQKFVKNTLKPRKATPKRDEVLMMALEGEKRESLDRGEGLSERYFPFYKRVTGGKVPVGQSQSDPVSLIDDSVSEGEINNCKCSISSGEVHTTCKLINERKMRPLRRHLEELASRREGNDKTKRIAKQRMEYNKWISYYLQKKM